MLDLHRSQSFFGPARIIWQIEEEIGGKFAGLRPLFIRSLRGSCYPTRAGRLAHSSAVRELDEPRGTVAATFRVRTGFVESEPKKNQNLT